MNDINDIEELFTIYRTKSNNSDAWNPAIKNVASHSFDPIWTAAVMYAVMSRYLSCLEDSDQLLFIQQTRKILDELYENGEEYTSFSSTDNLEQD